MSYTISNPNQLVYLASVWADPTELLNLCTSALGNQFQTQQARTTVQQQFSDVWKTVPATNIRFPNAGFKVYRYNAVLDSLITALLGSFDTRNRIIEVENPQNPTTAETLDATRRVDDATVAIRSSINNLMNELVRGTGMYNQAQFESVSGLTWATTATSS
ncbi:coat protein [Tropical soda apple mosaic virus]|uniref:Capsid protein n=1 Tax=Tropical soda apple mosaic virus TaxID=327387 RepID=Q4VFY0_9VIRU|nr:coat protein [Tropical soda apple mosaic virus]AAY28979.1 coat protein [Tropical soda apple mosaic virus]ANF29783.1 coat protein [Tropical soda apple mosaic virus]